MPGEQPETVKQPMNEFTRLCLVIFIGLLGAVINLAPLPLLPETQLIFGNAAYVFVAMHLLSRYTVFTAIITILPLYFFWGYGEYVVVFILEAAFIAFMRSKGWYVLLADMLYWLVIGLPITFIYLWIKSSSLEIIDVFILFKHGFNGLWYTCFACLIMFIFNQKLRINWQYQIVIHRTLRSKLMYSLVLLTVIALFSATLLISNHFLQASKSLINKSLKDSNQNIELVTEGFLAQHARALYLSNDWLSSQNSDNYTYILDRMKQRFPQFKALYIAEEESNVVRYTTSDKQAELNQQLPSITHPSYELLTVLEQSIAFKSSDVFLLTTDKKIPVMALEAGYHSIIDNKHYRLQGILDLSQRSGLYDKRIGDIKADTIMVDELNRVIQASSNLGFNTLDTFEYEILDKKDSLLTLKNGNIYYYKMSLTKYGWKVYSLIDYHQATNNIKEEYVMVFLILFFTLIATSYFAYEYGTRITQPVKYIINELSKFNNRKKMPSSLAASIEIIQLYDQIMANKNELYTYQDLLEDKVIERTKELNLANTKLEELALLDSLTQVNNRRYLDDNFTIVQKTAHRNLALMSLIMVDLDLFKKLNDQYGHLVGDNCLAGVAQLIKKGFDRASDIVVRFGGEEFVIVAPYITPAALALKIEELRLSIEQFNFSDEAGNKIHITASFGAVIADSSYSEDVLQWIQQADECLYEAKKAGRNCYRIRDKVSRLDNR